MLSQNNKTKIIVYISLVLIFTSIFLETKDYFYKEELSLNYEYINIKDMAESKVTNIKESTNIFKSFSSNKTLEEVKYDDVKEEELPVKNDTEPAQESPRRIWYLPTEIGRITQYPNGNHAAYDITSYRGTAETIFPVANGKISGIYTDPDGALVVTVLHEVDGKKYTSLYAHLSSYAGGIYVGKPVTINDALGQMGTTGRSTGVHLHMSLLDCALFDPNDPYCPDLNAWYRYDKLRLSQDFYGLGVVLYVPDSWYNR